MRSVTSEPRTMERRIKTSLGTAGSDQKKILMVVASTFWKISVSSKIRNATQSITFGLFKNVFNVTIALN